EVAAAEDTQQPLAALADVALAQALRQVVETNRRRRRYVAQVTQIVGQVGDHAPLEGFHAVRAAVRRQASQRGPELRELLLQSGQQLRRMRHVEQGTQQSAVAEASGPRVLARQPLDGL